MPNICVFGIFFVTLQADTGKAIIFELLNADIETIYRIANGRVATTFFGVRSQGSKWEFVALFAIWLWRFE